MQVPVKNIFAQYTKDLAKTSNKMFPQNKTASGELVPRRNNNLLNMCAVTPSGQNAQHLSVYEKLCPQKCQLLSCSFSQLAYSFSEPAAFAATAS